MLKRVRMFSAVALSAMAFAGSAASDTYDEWCMLHAGCFWEQTSDPTDPGHWVCSSPSIYMMCLAPEG